MKHLLYVFAAVVISIWIYNNLSGISSPPTTDVGQLFEHTGSTLTFENDATEPQIEELVSAYCKMHLLKISWAAGWVDAGTNDRLQIFDAQIRSIGEALAPIQERADSYGIGNEDRSDVVFSSRLSFVGQMLAISIITSQKKGFDEPGKMFDDCPKFSRAGVGVVVAKGFPSNVLRKDHLPPEVVDALSSEASAHCTLTKFSAPLWDQLRYEYPERVCKSGAWKECVQANVDACFSP